MKLYEFIENDYTFADGRRIGDFDFPFKSVETLSKRLPLDAVVAFEPPEDDGRNIKRVYDIDGLLTDELTLWVGYLTIRHAKGRYRFNVPTWADAPRVAVNPWMSRALPGTDRPDAMHTWSDGTQQWRSNGEVVVYTTDDVPPAGVYPADPPRTVPPPAKLLSAQNPDQPPLIVTVCAGDLKRALKLVSDEYVRFDSGLRITWGDSTQTIPATLLNDTNWSYRFVTDLFRRMIDRCAARDMITLSFHRATLGALAVLSCGTNGAIIMGVEDAA
jgi:hypothetical protein